MLALLGHETQILVEEPRVPWQNGGPFTALLFMQFGAATLTELSDCLCTVGNNAADEVSDHGAFSSLNRLASAVS